MVSLIQQIEQFAQEYGLTTPALAQKQRLKLANAIGQLCLGIVENDIPLIQASLGESALHLALLNSQLSFDDEFSFKTKGLGGINPVRDVDRTLHHLSEIVWRVNWLHPSYGMSEVDKNEKEKLYIDLFNRTCGLIWDLKSYARHYNLEFDSSIQMAFEKMKRLYHG